MPKYSSIKRYSLSSRIKNNPVIAVFVLIMAILSGSVTFFQDMRSLKNAIVCIPFELGILPYKGRAIITTTTREYEWKKISEESKVRGTKNHHCERNCRGEPTRTNYKIALNLPLSKEGFRRELRNPTLRCIDGPCGGWNRVIEARISNDGRRAVGSFDVWSLPTTWRLSAEVYERHASGGNEHNEKRDVSVANLFEIVVPNPNSIVSVEGTMSGDTKFSFQIGQTDKTGVFELLRKDEDQYSNKMLFIYRIKNPNCKT